MEPSDPPTVDSDHIQALVENTARLSKTSEDLALATIEYQERARLARRRYRVTITILLVFMMGFVIAVFVLLARGSQVRGTLLDCVQITGKCYQHGQRQTGKAVSSIESVIIDSAFCAATEPHPSQQGIQHCVTALLIKRH